VKRSEALARQPFHLEHGVQLPGRSTWNTVLGWELVPRETSSSPQSTSSTWNIPFAEISPAPRLTGQGIGADPLVADGDRLRAPGAEQKALLSFWEPGELPPQRSSTCARLLCSQAEWRPRLKGRMGMANQPTGVSWSPAERVDRPEEGGVALVACLAPHDPKRRLRVCGRS